MDKVEQAQSFFPVLSASVERVAGNGRVAWRIMGEGVELPGARLHNAIGEMYVFVLSERHYIRCESIFEDSEPIVIRGVLSACLAFDRLC